LRTRWRAEKSREALELHRPVAPIPAPPFTAAPVPPAATPANYAAIAQKDLFDRSRNPDVPVDPPPPPPPKPPMPPLPVFYGEMNIGDGPTAILSINASSPQHSTHPGEMIGPFKLIDVTRDDLTLKWNGQLVRKSVDELTNRLAGPPVDASAGRTDAPPPVQARVEAQAAKGPGETTPFGKLCQQNDTTPFGTVQDGYRKTEISTPFGKTCLWDPISK
jgi:hypothetical protein